jgi:hypothetical protein
MASADFDADGVADLAIGATRWYGVGSVYLLYGPATGSVAADDLVSISASAGAPTVTDFGSAVGAGDANGDGVDDLLVAADNIDEYYLFLGPITADRSTSDADAEFDLSSSPFDPPCVDVTGDLDGDGGADLVMTAPYESMVYVASGTASGMLEMSSDATYSFKGASNGKLGFAITEMGDTNGDGITDLALGAATEWPPRGYVVPGGLEPGGYDAEDVATATFVLSPYVDNPPYLGWSLASGDYDGDGASDLFVGAIFATASTGVEFSGAVYGLLGPLSGEMRVGNDASVRWENSGTLTEVGESVAVDDLNGDGTQDVAIGGHVRDAVYLQLGYATGVVDVGTLPRIQTPGFVDGSDDFGTWITPISDWTGDGGAELALGAPLADGATTQDAGAVQVFFSESWE